MEAGVSLLEIQGAALKGTALVHMFDYLSNCCVATICSELSTGARHGYQLDTVPLYKFCEKVTGCTSSYRIHYCHLKIYI